MLPYLIRSCPILTVVFLYVILKRVKLAHNSLQFKYLVWSCSIITFQPFCQALILKESDLLHNGVQLRYLGWRCSIPLSFLSCFIINRVRFSAQWSISWLEFLATSLSSPSMLHIYQARLDVIEYIAVISGCSCSILTF